MISIVFPVYNEAQNIEELHRRIVDTLNPLNEPYEIIAVDDGSTDGSRTILRRLKPLTTVLFARNFGEDAAFDAGIKTAIGDIVVTIDSDLENHPEDIPSLIRALREQNAGVVAGWRQERNETWKRSLFSQLSNWLVRTVTHVPLHDFGCSLKAYRREYIDDLHLTGETMTFMPVFAHARGAKVIELPIRFTLRKAGHSKHHVTEMGSVFFDLISVQFLVSYFSRPLRFFGGMSLVAGFLAICAFTVALILKLSGREDFSATPLPIIGTLFTLLCVILFMLGFITEILLRIYYETTQRNPYYIAEVIKNA